MLYFQGTDNKLWFVNPDGSGWASNMKTVSAPIAIHLVDVIASAGDRVYFQGPDNNLGWTDRSGGWHGLAMYQTSSSPCVTDKFVYFRGTDDVLWRVDLDGNGGRRLGDNPSKPFKTKSTPFAYGQFIFFQGTDDELWRIKLDGSGGMNMRDALTRSAPFVAGNHVYIHGKKDDGIWRINLDGTGSSRIPKWQTKSTPVVTSEHIFFQGTDDKLWRINLDGSGGIHLGSQHGEGYRCNSAPAVDERAGFVYFQGKDDILWRTALDGSGGVNFGGFKCHSTPFVGRPRVTQSARPIIDNQVITLGPGQSHTFDIRIDRVGEFFATAGGATAPTLQLFDPARKLAASGARGLTHNLTQRDLHLASLAGPFWHLTVTIPSNAHGPEQCKILAQVYDTLRIPAEVLQQRLALLGGENLEFRVNWNQQKKNIVYIKMNERLALTLDSFGLLDQFETMRANDYDHTTQKVPLDAGRWYPINTFDLGLPVVGGGEIHNLVVGAIAAVVKTIDGLPCVAFTASLQPDPHGPTQFKRLGLTVDIRSLTVNLALKLLPDGEGGLTGSSKASVALNLHPDVNERVDVSKKLAAKLEDKANPALASALSSVFTTLMGGTFTMESAAWRDNGFVFGYIPSAEEPPRQVSPNYSARGVVAPGTPPQWKSPNLEKIDHMVVLMMENRSFDHVLGYLSLTKGRTDIDGLTQDLLNSFDPDVRPIGLTETRLPFDPDHSYAGDFGGVAMQIDNDEHGKGPMRGFVRSFLKKYPFMANPPGSPARHTLPANPPDPFEENPEKWLAMADEYTKNAVMRYHTEKTLPFYDYLASEYMVCDRWYSSHPGPTFPNRFFYLMGHLNVGPDGKPELDNGQDHLRLLRFRNIQDALTERGVSWKMYESPPDVAMLRMYARYAFDDTNIHPIADFFTAVRAGTLPSVTFLEPNFHIGETTNDDHPPSDMAHGQAFIQRVYEGLKSNLTAWNKTLFIITYDEHGGLYDHHLPELADRYAGQPERDRTYGVRVSAFIVSPWVPAGVTTRKITPAVFDHTSILKTIVNRFCPNDPPILSDRMAFANDLFPLLTLGTPRVTTLPAALASALQVTTVGAGAVAAAAARPATTAHMLADARAAGVPLRRVRQVSAGNADWHQQMMRLSLMLK
jgi:phospholipase C